MYELEVNATFQLYRHGIPDDTMATVLNSAPQYNPRFNIIRSLCKKGLYCMYSLN